MSTHRDFLPQLDADLFLTDGGIETTLIFDDGIDLPDFAAFVLLDSEIGRAALHRYFDAYVGVAARDGCGVVLETPTWRASLDWTSRQGYDVASLVRLNTDAVALLQDVRLRHSVPSRPGGQVGGPPIVISGCIGPRGDGYQPGELMSWQEARNYHALQARVFAEAGADLVTAITMTYPAEAIGVAEAARNAGMPVVISFTTETDGRLPSGGTLRDAVEEVDAATNGYPAYYMVNCAHPTHFEHVLEPGAAWTTRIRGLRANASMASHAELDEAETLDPGDPEDLADRYRRLRARYPHVTVLGGCCGTSHRHVGAISAACSAA
jgi:S-methylmethionine-dependent homocysteine/selenocysteine methylase